MTEEQSEKRTCDLKLYLSRYGGIHTWYDAKVGLRRSMVLFGRINDHSDSAFNGKICKVEVLSPADRALLEEVRALIGEGNPCGIVEVTAGVVPESFELDGEVAEIEPVDVRLHVTSDAFEAINRQATDADAQHRVMMAELTISGDAILEPESRFSNSLNNLDVSKPQRYVVANFEIFDTRYFDHLRDRVLHVERGKDVDYGANISVLLTDVHYRIYTERAHFSGISCNGHVVNSSGKPYDGADVTINFREFEDFPAKRLNRRAFFGEFGYWLKHPDEKYSSTFFWFDLNYVTEDARDLLIPLLSQGNRTQVVLNITLVNTKEEMLSATHQLRGNVMSYNFQVRQNLGNNA